MKKFVDLSDPFFAPIWIRIAVVVITAAWGLFELSIGKTIWPVIFLGISAICAWRFSTINYNSKPEH